MDIYFPSISVFFGSLLCQTPFFLFLGLHLRFGRAHPVVGSWDMVNGRHVFEVLHIWKCFTGVIKPWPIDEMYLGTCFVWLQELRMLFTFLRSYKTNKEGYATETICGPRSLWYLVSCSLQKKSLSTSVLSHPHTDTLALQKIVLHNTFGFKSTLTWPWW